MLDAALPPFPGFRKEAFQFLRELKANNDRAWFKPRKSTFDDEVLWPMRCLVAQLGSELPACGLPITGDPQRAVFRIYRDTRFSPNKDPYKTHIGAYMTQSGDRKEDGGVYVHVGADECFFGGGFWNADPALVRRWRERMAAMPAEFMEIVSAIEDAGLEMRRQDPLKRLPRGYEELVDSPTAEYLKAKGIFAMRPIKEKDAASPSMVDTVLDAAVAVRPLLEWGWGLK